MKTLKNHNRREFFKEAARKALPIIGAIALLSNPVIAKVVEKESTGCNYGCAGTCSGSCTGTCMTGCYTQCYNTCKTTCYGTCTGGCNTSCNGSCRGVEYFG